MFFNPSKAFDPQLDDLEYIDMSGANMLKSVNSSKELESSTEYSTSTPNSLRYIPRIGKQTGDWSNSMLQDLVPSVPNSPPECEDFISQTFEDKGQKDDTYVSIHGSPTYLDPLCISCMATTSSSNYKKDSTYQSITTVPGTPISVQPPVLPSRRYSCHISNAVETFSEVRQRSKSDACHCSTAQRRKLSQFRPSANDVLSAVGTRHYTVQEVFDSVAQLTKELPNQDHEIIVGEKQGVKRNSSISMNNCDVPNKISKRQSFRQTQRKSEENVYITSQAQAVCGSPYRMDTYDTFSSCRLSQKTINKEAPVYSSICDVRLPLTPKKDNHRRSFLEHINAFSSVKLCRSKSRRSAVTEQSFCGSTKSIRSGVKSPFSRKSFLRTSFRGFKRDKVADVNNNGRIPSQPRFDFGIYPGCPKETHF